MMAWLNTQTYKRVHFPPGAYQYEGAMMQVKGTNWRITGDGDESLIWRSTNGKLIVLDGRVAFVVNVVIEGLRFYSTVAMGSRGNIHGVELLADPTVEVPFQNIDIRRCSGSGVETVAHFTKTKPLPYGGYDQLENYFQINLVDLRGDQNSGGQGNPTHIVKFEGGTGSHINIRGGSYRSEGYAIEIGDGTMAVHDTLIDDVHLLGKAGGLHIIAPTDPLRFRGNIAVFGCDFDGGVIGTDHYTYWFENLSYFTVLGCNQERGLAPKLTNCSAPYFAEDGVRNLLSPAANLIHTEGVAIGAGLYLASQVANDRTRMIGGIPANQGASFTAYGQAHATLSNRAFIDALRTQIRSQSGSAVYVDVDPANGKVVVGDGLWNGQRLVLGGTHTWIDGAGSLRLKSSAPASASDGAALAFAATTLAGYGITDAVDMSSTQATIGGLKTFTALLKASAGFQVTGGTIRGGNGGVTDYRIQTGVAPAISVGGSSLAAFLLDTFGTAAGGAYHVVIQIPANDSSDGFAILTDANLDATCDTLALKIRADGWATTMRALDGGFVIAEDSDTSKTMRFDTGPIAAGTQRSLQVPDASGVLVLDTNTQTLTGKTISFASNTLTGVAPLASPVFTGAPKAPSYTVGTAPSASAAGAGAFIYVTNESGGAAGAESDGTNWRRYSDRAIIS